MSSSPRKRTERSSDAQPNHDNQRSQEPEAVRFSPASQVPGYPDIVDRCLEDDVPTRDDGARVSDISAPHWPVIASRWRIEGNLADHRPSRWKKFHLRFDCRFHLGP